MNRERVELWLRRAVDYPVRGFAVVLPAAVSFIVRYRVLAFALGATLVYYFPSLRNGSVDAGYLYGGDVVGFYWPSMAKAHALLSAWHFSAIDFSQFDGSAEFFLAPNFFAVHPLLVVYSLLSSESATMADIGRWLVVMLAVHAFIASYFTAKLLTRHFWFDYAPACFAAAVFAFSALMVQAHNEPEFVFCCAVLPWAVYGSLSFAEVPRPAELLAGSLPVLFALLGGYVPLAAATLALAVAIVAVHCLILDGEGGARERFRHFVAAMAPFALASAIAAPYLFAVSVFVGHTPGAGLNSLRFSAHQLADSPQTLLRLLSFRYSVPGPQYEFSVTWGLVAVTVAALFLLSARTFAALNGREWAVMKACAVAYAATVLCTFGNYSVVSDLVYYFVPQIGSMHIYQRFLLPAQLLLGMMLALMLKSLVVTRPPLATRVAIAVLALATLSAAYVVARAPGLAQETGINNYVVLELFLAFLFVLALLVPGRNLVLAAATVLVSLPSLDLMYDYSDGGNVRAEQAKREPVALDEDMRGNLVSYLKRRFGDKDLIKYVDATPMWSDGVETFPKSFPYLVMKDLRLSSFDGFNLYLSSRADYIRSNQIVAKIQMNPDWERVANTGVDFIVAREADVTGGTFDRVIAGLDKEDLYRLPHGVVIVPLRPVPGAKASAPMRSFDNGYFRVVGGHLEARVALHPSEDIARYKRARQSSTWGGEAARAVDGNTDGVFEDGSVASTGQDRHAWFEVDLGQREKIGRVRIWNRTDGPGARLRNFWILISDSPFRDSDTAAQARGRPGVWSKVNGMPDPALTVETPGVEGRYVRAQLDGSQALDDSWLSIAELEVYRADNSREAAPAAEAPGPAVLQKVSFATNGANYLRLDVDASGPASVQYLLWNNPRLRYYLNGEQTSFLARDDMVTINVPAGHSTIEVSFRNWPLTLFWVFMASYVVAWLWLAALPLLIQGFRRLRRN